MSESHSASAQVISDGTLAQTVTDKQGRVLELRKLTPLDRMRVAAAGGAEKSQVPYWLGSAMIACCVTKIDDFPIAFPKNDKQIENLVGRLGDDGMEAVGAAFMDANQSDEDSLAQAKN